MSQAPPTPKRGMLDEARSHERQGRLHQAIEVLERAKATVCKGTSKVDSIDRRLKDLLEALSADPYNALQLPGHATKAEAKKSYRKLCLLYHPDKNEHTESLFKVCVCVCVCVCVKCGAIPLASTPPVVCVSPRGEKRGGGTREGMWYLEGGA